MSDLVGNPEDRFSYVAAHMFLFCFVDYNFSINNISVTLGQRHHFLGINWYCAELMCLAKE